MIGTIICQIAVLMFAWCSGPEEGHYTWPFRVLSETVFSRADKKKHSSGAHKWGYAGVIIVCVGMAALGTLTDHRSLPYGAILAFACGLCYGTVFDPSFAIFIGQKWDYVGNPKSDDPYNSSSDDIINRILQKHAGRKKFFIFLILLAGLNIILYLW